jgi:hypothetical protein
VKKLGVGIDTENHDWRVEGPTGEGPEADMLQADVRERGR